MSARVQFIGFCLVGAIVYAVNAINKTPDTVVAKTESTISVEESVVAKSESGAAQSGYEQEVQARVQKLVEMSAKKASHDLAGSKMTESRKFLAITYRPQWANVLATNWSAFMGLRQKAAHTPTRETPCTLCDGNGSEPFCILCPKRVGKCVTCQGSGHIVAGQVCPTCYGNGACYLCFGSGKMLCPFCNNGVIEFRRPLPQGYMPTN